MKQFTTCIAFLLLLLANVCPAQWTALPIDSTKYVVTVNFLDDDLGYAILLQTSNSNKTLVKTTDGGSTWMPITLPVLGPDLQDIDFSADGVGVAVLRQFNNPVTPTIVFKTSNDGAAWQDITPDSTEAGIGTALCQFLNPNEGYVATGTTIYKTTDGGANWTKTLTNGYPMSIDFIDANHGTMGLFDGTFGYLGGIMTTTDGGANWRTLWLTQNGTVIGEVGQLTSTISYAAPVKFGSYAQHKFFKTTDNGLTWDTIAVPDTLPNSSMGDIYFKDVLHGVITVGDYNARTNVYETTDGGTTWTLQDTLPSFDVSDLELTANAGYLAGRIGTLYRLDLPLSVAHPVVKGAHFFPNPAQPGRRLQWQGTENFTQVTLIDLTGKVVAQTDLAQQNWVLPQVNAGLYILQLTGANGVYAAKLLVE